MTYVIRMGNTYRLMDEADIEVCEKLPAQNYSVGVSPSGEYFLEPVDRFLLPRKLYGDTVRNAERILSTFDKRPLTTGVHMNGVKGSGKTLLAKVVADMGVKQGLATVLINQPHCGESFNKFVQSIDVPAIFLFDEFEKVYDYEHQNKILTLFDGVYPTKKLFLITTNEAHAVSNYLRNRPGRIYYSFEFDTLSPEFVREYCEDNLNDQSQIESVVKYVTVFSYFNFDMLAACIEEMNRYNESLLDVLKFLNITPESKATDSYKITLVFNDKQFVLDENYYGYQPNEFEYYVPIAEMLQKTGAGEKAALGSLGIGSVRARRKKQTSEPVAVGRDFLTELLDDLPDVSAKSTHIEFKATMIKSFDAVSNTFVYGTDYGGQPVRLVVAKNAAVPQFDPMMHML